MGFCMTNFAVVSLHSSPLDQPGSGDGGGMNVYVFQLASALARLGNDVNIYTRATSQDDPARIEIEPGLRVHNVPAGPLAALDKDELFEYVDEFTENVIARIQIDRSLKPDVVHSNYWISGLVGHKLKHFYQVPMITTFHTIEAIKAIGRTVPDDRVSEAFRMDAEDQIAGCSDFVLASCDQEALDIQRYLGLAPERIAVVPLGVEHAYFAPGDMAMARSAMELPQNDPISLYVGRIQPLKGLATAFEAFSCTLGDFPNSRFVVVGGPSGHLGEVELDYCFDMARSKGFEDKIIWRQPEPHIRLASYYRAANLVVVPSRTESFGLVALEAMASGTPVVASSVGGLKSLISHGRTGLLAPVRNGGVFANLMLELLSTRERSSMIARNALMQARTYSWKEAAERALSVVESLDVRQLIECG